MPRFSTFYTLIIALGYTSYALEFQAPIQTNVPVPNETGTTPTPTDSPYKLRQKRQRTSTRTSLTPLTTRTAYSDTCGFYSTSLSYDNTYYSDYDGYSNSEAVACESGGCVRYQVGSDYYQGCCSTGYYGSNSCQISTTCYDYNDVYSFSRCDSDCLSYNSAILACTDVFSQYCVQYNFYDGATGFGCASSSSPATISADSIATSYYDTVYTVTPVTLAAAAFSFSSSYSTTTDRYYRYPSDDYNRRPRSALFFVLTLPIIVVVIWAIFAFACAFLVCRERRRKEATWYEPGGPLYGKPVPRKLLKYYNPKAFHPDLTFSISNTGNNSAPHAINVHPPMSGPSPRNGPLASIPESSNSLILPPVTAVTSPHLQQSEQPEQMRSHPESTGSNWPLSQPPATYQQNSFGASYYDGHQGPSAQNHSISPVGTNNSSPLSNMAAPSIQSNVVNNANNTREASPGISANTSPQVAHAIPQSEAIPQAPQSSPPIPPPASSSR